MTTDEWDSVVVETRDKMTAHVAPYVTPISRSDNLERGWSWGTGNYVQSDTAKIVTNEHVAAAAATDFLAHLPIPGDWFVLCVEPFLTLRHPFDIATSPCIVQASEGTRAILVRDQFDDAYGPVEGEILFWVGYPGTTAGQRDAVTEANTRYSWFSELETTGYPVAAQALRCVPSAPPAGFSEAYHVLVHYPSEAKVRVHGATSPVANPAGMSGSLLWDTKRVEAMCAKRDWFPDQARVCGLIWGASENPDVVVATRIEKVLPVIFNSNARAYAAL
jgi:hypothetical protein